MDYKKKEVGKANVSLSELRQMHQTIMSYIKGTSNGQFFTERTRQFWTWGANRFQYVCATDGCYGIQFKVSGMLHKGRVRIYYNPATDYFDVELLRPIKDELVWGCDEIDFVQLHNVLHRHIERTDDVEV